MSHGLRALGLERGDTVAAVMPNGIEFLQLYLGATQIGLYLTPINHHLVGPEIAYIVNDSDAKVLIGHERFADELAQGRRRDRRARTRGASPSARSTASARAPSCSTASRTPHPHDRIAGAPCTTRRARPASPRA